MSNTARTIKQFGFDVKSNLFYDYGNPLSFTLGPMGKSFWLKSLLGITGQQNERANMSRSEDSGGKKPADELDDKKIFSLNDGNG